MKERERAVLSESVIQCPLADIRTQSSAILFKLVPGACSSLRAGRTGFVNEMGSPLVK
jgi:hypothetical protein